MTRTSIKINNELDIIQNIIASTKYAEKIIPILEKNSNVFKVSYSRLVFKWVKDHFNKYSESPNKDIVELWFQDRKKEYENEEELTHDVISLFLKNLSKRYEESVNENIQFLVDTTINYINERKAELLKEIEDPKQFIEAVEKFHPVVLDEPKELFSRIGDIEVKPAQWAIKNLFQSDTTTVFFGEPGAGKSFIGLDIAASIACGIDFHSLQTKITGPTLYVAGEGRYTIARRMRAWSIYHNIDLSEYPFYILNAEIELVDEKKILPLKFALEEINRRDGPPRAVIIDTWSTCRGGNNENDNNETAKALNNLRIVCKPYECSRQIIHHNGAADKTRLRGATSFKGNIDNEYRVEKSPLGKISVINSKMKDAAMPDKLFFDFREIDLGIKDESGFEEKSAVIVQDGDYIAPKKTRLGKNEKLGLNFLTEDKTKLILWREYMLSTGLSKSIVSQVKSQLIEKDLISIEKGFIIKI